MHQLTARNWILNSMLGQSGIQKRTLKFWNVGLTLPGHNAVEAQKATLSVQQLNTFSLPREPTLNK